MGFVLPYNHEVFSLADGFPEAYENYPGLIDELDELLEQRFSYDNEGTWSVDIPELGFEGIFEEESFDLGLNSAYGRWTTELDFSSLDDGELNLNWSGPAEVFDVDGDRLGQTFEFSADIANLAAKCEIETDNDGEAMTDKFNVKIDLDQDETSNLEVNFSWDHEGDLFDIDEQTYELEIDTAIKGECPIGNCAITTDIATSHTVDGDEKNNVLALTYNMKPRIAWVTAQVNKDDHHVIGFRSENRDGKSTSFENLGYLSIYYKKFNSKTNRPGKVANNRQGTLVATIPLINGIIEEIIPEIEEFLEPFTKIIDVMSEKPESIPAFLVHFDTWTLSLTDEFDASEVIAATRFESDLLGIDNEDLQKGAEEAGEVVVEALQSDELVKGFEVAREIVLDLFGDEGKENVQDLYL